MSPEGQRWGKVRGWWLLLHRLLDVAVCGFLIAVVAACFSSLLLIATGLARHHSLVWTAFEALVFSLFTIANLWPGLLFFGGWIVFFCPRTPLRWSLLLGVSFLSGIFASYVFQAYPVLQSDPGSVVNTPAVSMVSPITYISCFATVFSVSLVAFFYSACEEKGLSVTNVLADGSI